MNSRSAKWLALALCSMGILWAAATDGTRQQALLSWGDPEWTEGDDLTVDSAPSWFVAAYKMGGNWLDPAEGWTGWGVEPSDPNFTALEIELNRAALPGDLAMRVRFFDVPASALYVDLLDADGRAVATNVAGNLMSGSSQIAESVTRLPLAAHPGAATIQLRCDHGGVAVFSTELTALLEGSAADAEPAADQGPALEAAADAPAAQRGEVLPAGAAELAISQSATGVSFRAAREDGALGDAGNAAASRLGAGRMVYVDARHGRDANSGRLGVSAMAHARAAELAGISARSTNGTPRAVSQPARASSGALWRADGPKATITAGLAEARARDTLVICEGTYGESLHLAGRDLRVAISGAVNLTGHAPGRQGRSAVPARVSATNAIPHQVMPGGPQ